MDGLPEHVVTAASLTLFKKYLRTIDFSSYIKFDRNLYTSILLKETRVCVCVQNCFCPYALISTPNVP